MTTQSWHIPLARKGIRLAHRLGHAYGGGRHAAYRPGWHAHPVARGNAVDAAVAAAFAAGVLE